MKRRITHNTHPGEIFSEEIIKPSKLTVVQAAELLKITSATLSNIINGNSPILPDIAIRIAKVFGGNPDLWLRLQRSYDLKETESKSYNDD